MSPPTRTEAGVKAGGERARKRRRARRARVGLPRPVVAVALALACGVVGAGIVHIASVLTVPANAPRTGYDVAGELGADGRFVALPEDDPFLRSVVCRFDLDEPVRVYAEGAVPFWSASVIGEDGVNAYSVNDRVALGGTLDLVVLRSADVADWRDVLSDEIELVPLASGAGMAVLRAFVPDETWGPTVAGFLEGATCEPVERD